MKLTWYRTISPKWGRGFNLDSQIRLATKREITKYKLADVKGNLLTGNRDNRNILFCQSKEQSVEYLVSWIKGEVDFAEYRLRCTMELQAEFIKQQEEEQARLKREAQMIKDSRGLGI